jgi:hypothetical protein
MSALNRPDILYKYLPPERLDVLSNGLIRYTQFGAFNDPFDGQPHFTALSTDDDLKERFAKIFPDEIRRSYDSLSSELKAQLPYGTFYETAVRLIQQASPSILENASAMTPHLQAWLRERLDMHIGALSLSEVVDNVLMWTHYSSAHKGFALGFDAGHPYLNARLSEVDEFRYLRRVEYRNERPNAPFSDLTGIEMFLVKSTDWAYEKEWRIMRPLEDSETVIESQPLPVHLFRYPGEALQEIVLGARMPLATRNEVLELIAAQSAFQHVAIKEACIDQQTYRIWLSDTD